MKNILYSKQRKLKIKDNCLASEETSTKPAESTKSELKSVGNAFEDLQRIKEAMKELSTTADPTIDSIVKRTRKSLRRFQGK